MDKIEQLYFDAEFQERDNDDTLNEYKVFEEGYKSRDKEIKKFRKILGNYKLLEHGELVKEGDEKWSDSKKQWIKLNAWDRGSESYYGEYYNSRWQPVRREINNVRLA